MPTRTADAAHEPDRMPTEEEDAAADASTDELERSGEEGSVARHYREMTRLGVEQKGEGRIE
jgi:hypothetical protein